MVPWIPVMKPYLKQQPLQVAPPFQQQKFQPWQQRAVQPQYRQHGGWQNQAPQFPRKPPPTVAQNFQVDNHARYTGVCDFYAKWKGFGFIILNQKGIVPNDSLFVHWKSLQSDDRYPCMVKGLEVEFGIQKVHQKYNPNLTTLQAANVCLIGGMNIAVQDELDAREKQFVGGPHLRFTGTLKFFSPRLGFGYVTMDPGYDVEDGVPSELRVETPEINAGGRNPVHMQNLAVEFGIWKTQRSRHKVYNMTLPGGHPLTQDALENRISMAAQNYNGEVVIWNWRQAYGFLRVSASTQLPTRVLMKLQEQVQAARQRGRNIVEEKLLYFRRPDCVFGYTPQRGNQVSFQLYIDDKGAGACNVNGLGI